MELQRRRSGARTTSYGGDHVTVDPPAGGTVDHDATPTRAGGSPRCGSTRGGRADRRLRRDHVRLHAGADELAASPTRRATSGATRTTCSAAKYERRPGRGRLHHDVRRRRPADVHHRRAWQDGRERLRPARPQGGDPPRLGRRCPAHQVGLRHARQGCAHLVDPVRGRQGVREGGHRLRPGRAADGRVGDDPVRPGRGGVGEDVHDDLRLQGGRQHRRPTGTARAGRPAGRDARARLQRRRPARHGHRRADLRHATPSYNGARRGGQLELGAHRHPAGPHDVLRGGHPPDQPGADRAGVNRRCRGQRPAVRLRPDRATSPGSPNWITGSACGQPVLRVRPPAAGHRRVDRGCRRLCGGADRPPVGGPAPYWQEYGYDAIGNRRSQTVKGVAGGGRRRPDLRVPRPGTVPSGRTR